MRTATRTAAVRAPTAGATAIPAVAAAPVMGTGIVCVALELDGARAVSDALLAVALALALVLAAQVAIALRTDRARVAREIATPAGLRSWPRCACSGRGCVRRATPAPRPSSCWPRWRSGAGCSSRSCGDGDGRCAARAS